MSMSTEVGIVVPYYQREPGILARALRSVARQTGEIRKRVVVVDDGSPARSETEIIGLPANPSLEVEVIEQDNAGPGAARNRALDALADERFVAFLDSDDEWSADHLERALLALAGGFDAYFADHLQLGADVSAFARAGRIDPAKHEAIHGAKGLYAYVGNMLDQVISGNVIGTSTVVYDRARFRAARFRPEYRNAGEDYLFWIALASAGARFAFSDQCEAIYGRGVNVYAGAGWGTETHFLRLHNDMKYRKAIVSEHRLTKTQTIKLHGDIRQLRVAIARDLLHRVAHRKALPWPWLRDQLRLDPATFALLPWHTLRLLAVRREEAPSS